MIRRLLVATLTTTALAAAACGGSSGSGSGSGSTAATPPPTAQSVTFVETEFKIDTATTTLKAGDYTFQVQNMGSFPHDLHIATPDRSEAAKTPALHSQTTTTPHLTPTPAPH